MANQRKSPRVPLPSPAEIAERAAAIRATWDAATTWKRLAVKPPALLEIAEIHEVDLICALGDLESSQWQI